MVTVLKFRNSFLNFNFYIYYSMVNKKLWYLQTLSDQQISSNITV